MQRIRLAATAAIIAFSLSVTSSAALAPPEDMRAIGSNFLGSGSLSCRAIGDLGLDGRMQDLPRETRQWILGYLSAIDGNVFKHRQGMERSDVEARIIKRVTGYLDEFCYDNPQAGLGDGLRALKTIHHSERFKDMLDQIIREADEQRR